MSKVESRRVISNRRNTVGLVHTSTSAPLRRVSRRSPLSRTLRPVESMNSTRVKSSTSAVLPSAIAALRRSEKRGAVLTWISPAASRMRVRASTSVSEISNLGCGKSDMAARTYPLAPEPDRQSVVVDLRRPPALVARGLQRDGFGDLLGVGIGPRPRASQLEGRGAALRTDRGGAAPGSATEAAEGLVHDLFLPGAVRCDTCTGRPGPHAADPATDASPPREAARVVAVQPGSFVAHTARG